MSEKLVIIESEAKKIFDDAKELHQEISGEPLLIASEEVQVYSTIAAILSNLRAEMNQIAIQNYLKYARGERLDLKGDFYGEKGKRLDASNSRTTMRCHISSIINRDVIIPKGTRFLKDKLLFKTIEENKIITGNKFVDIIVVSTIKGELPVILIGEITKIVDTYDYYQSCENITNVAGGSGIEKDDRYRERIRQIPESFTTAGSEGSYIFATKKSSPLINQVKIDSPFVNVIDIYVLGENGIRISAEEKEKILKDVNSIEIRPLGDLVTIKDPEFIDYKINLEYTTYENNLKKISDLDIEIKEVLENYKNSFKIGESLNTQDIIRILKEIGLKKINLKTLNDIVVSENQYLNCIEIKIIYAGEGDFNENNI